MLFQYSQVDTDLSLVCSSDQPFKLCLALTYLHITPGHTWTHVLHPNSPFRLCSFILPIIHRHFTLAIRCFILRLVYVPLLLFADQHARFEWSSFISLYLHFRIQRKNKFNFDVVLLVWDRRNIKKGGKATQEVVSADVTYELICDCILEDLLLVCIYAREPALQFKIRVAR